ncbi:MAG TPA: M56 family metallopeptidase [Chitinophagaceae bacterium]|nr:M56 family metallopeptidase [Chitinophagaceae bacterium]
MDNIPALIQYLLKLSVSMAVVYLFYQLVLRRITFYNWNRWYLLGYSVLCFLIPFIDISPVLQQQEWNDSQIVQWLPALSYGTTETTITVGETVSVSNSWSAWDITKVIFVVGVIIMALRLLIQVISFRRLMKKAKLVTIDEMKLYEVDASIIPFSFGNSIFVNPALHSTKELEEIIRHEFVHVKQRHSIDIIWGELLCLFNWYNPFAWLIRASIRQNLEFIADNKVLQHGIDRKQYQYLLLKVMGNHQFSIANQFNFSSLKKRIAMMNKIKSAKVHLLRFLFVLPLLAILLVSFREKISRLLHDDKAKTETAINEETAAPTPALQNMYVAGKVVDQNTYEPMANVPLKVFVNDKLIATLKTDAEGYYYYADEIGKRQGEKPMYEILIDNPAYYRVNGGTTANTGNESGLYHTIFLASKKVKGRSIAYDLGIPATEVSKAMDQFGFVKAEIARISDEMIEQNKEERKISAEFLSQNPSPSEWFTLYKGRIFSKQGRLMGDENKVRFYIMDEPITYQQVNEKFRDVKELPHYTGSWKEGEGWREMNFMSDEYNKVAPPADLMLAANVKKISVDDFIHTDLNGKIVYVNGRRNTTKGFNGMMFGKPGAKKNMYSIQQKAIKNVFIFKNELAHYYHPIASEVYWIEMNNGVEVINRPKFAGYTYTDTIPKKPNSKGYYVEIIGVGGDCTVLVTDKNHKEIKRILLNDWDAKEDYYTNLYGMILPPAVEQPPVPPAPPSPVASIPLTPSKTKVPPTPPMPGKIGAPGAPAAPVGDPPLPPKPVKTEIDVTGHITITPSLAYEKSPVTKPVINGSYELIADTLMWIPLTRTLEFRGVDQQLKNSRIAGKFTINDVRNDPYILVDGKEFDPSYQTYAEFGKTLKITFLSKTEAVKKYGAKGKNGAIEIVPFGC